MGACCSARTEHQVEVERRQSLHLKAVQKRSSLRNNLVQQSAGENPWEKYELVRQLGVGSMGSVASVRRKHGSTNKLFAIKTLRLGRLTKAFIKELQTEIKIVSDLDHPGIVKFYEVYCANRQIYIVMELSSGGDLYKRAPYTEPQAANVLEQLLAAVNYMHNQGYVHRDLKVRSRGVHVCFV